VGKKQEHALSMLALKPWLLVARVSNYGDEEDGACWPCTLSKNKYGYSSVRIGPTSVLAHRAMYWLANGPFDLSLHVCHSCDNPSCCNPMHLFLGTHQENMEDMKRKARRKGIGTGESNGRARLTTSDVEQIRAKRDAGQLLKQLSHAYGVGMSTVSRVCKGENWK
jgi:hypothetical protein